jgi:hypothetical protein
VSALTENGCLDSQYLLCNDAEHFQFNSVELIKAAPASTAAKSFEKFAHCSVVELVTAVKNNAVFSYCFCKVFSGFRLACSCRAFRGSSQILLKSTHQSTVTAISQRRYYQTALIS